VAAGPKGTVYYGWQDGTQPNDSAGGTTTSARVATSKDNGKTWSKVTDLSTPLGLHNVQFPEMIVGDDDRAAFSFIATPGIGNDQNAPFKGAWRLYISTTYDGGKTWRTVDATQNKPIHRGCVHMLGLAPGSQRTDNCDYRNMLDFNDITIDQYGRPEISYTDDCFGDCASGAKQTPENTSVSNVSVAHQIKGKTLYAKYDNLFGNR